MTNYTTGNFDNLDVAIEGLGQFCHNWCMNVAETDRGELTFRCEECEFGERDTGVCFVKKFLNSRGTPEQADKCTAMGSL